jgi:hypothetical protein
VTSIPNSIETRDAHHSPATVSMYSRPGIDDCTLNDPNFCGRSHRQTTPPGLSNMGVGSNWSSCSSPPEPLSVLRARTDCGGRFFTAKLGVVVHYLPHQLLDDRPRHTLQRSEA